MKTKTPRTDAEMQYPIDFGIAVDVNFAKKLERELNEINALANELWNWANMMPDSHIARLSKIIDISGGVNPPNDASKLSHREEKP